MQGREPFVSYEGLEQLHRFLFVLGITHVLYSCVAVGLAMSKVHHSLFIWPHLSMFTLRASCSFKGVLGYYMKTNQSVLCFCNIEGVIQAYQRWIHSHFGAYVRLFLLWRGAWILHENSLICCFTVIFERHQFILWNGVFQNHKKWSHLMIIQKIQGWIITKIWDWNSMFSLKHDMVQSVW